MVGLFYFYLADTRILILFGENINSVLGFLYQYYFC